MRLHEWGTPANDDKREKKQMRCEDGNQKSNRNGKSKCGGSSLRSE
jgi:hypothetical protein